MAKVDYTAALLAPSLDDKVELLETCEHSLRVERRQMTLRDAISAVLVKTPSLRALCGIGLHAPVEIEINGRRALQGYLAGPTVQDIWGDPPGGSTQHSSSVLGQSGSWVHMYTGCEGWFTDPPISRSRAPQIRSEPGEQFWRGFGDVLERRQEPS